MSKLVKIMPCLDMQNGRVVKGVHFVDIADAGAIMPPKSTWFEPKLRSGLFIHKLK